MILNNIIRAPHLSSLSNLNIVADGNSYVAGNGYTPFPTYIIQTAPFSTNGSSMQNFGVGGQTTPNMLSDQATQILPSYVAGKTNILLVVEGGNDILKNGSVANAVTNMITYCQNAIKANFKVITATCIRRGQDGAVWYGDSEIVFNQKLLQYNASILNYSYCFHGIIRPELDDLFLNYYSNGYDADHVHPNVMGQKRYADLFIAAINKL